FFWAVVALALSLASAAPTSTRAVSPYDLVRVSQLSLVPLRGVFLPRAAPSSASDLDSVWIESQSGLAACNCRPMVGSRADIPLWALPMISLMVGVLSSCAPAGTPVIASTARAVTAARAVHRFA